MTERYRPPKWVKLWLSDLHGSSAKAQLSGQAWLLYCAVLVEQPQIGRLPADPTRLALHMRLDPAWALPLIEEIRAWLEEDDGGLYSPRMEAEVGKSLAAIDAAAAKGAKGGKASGKARQPEARVEAGVQAELHLELEAGVQAGGQARIEQSQSQNQIQTEQPTTDSPAQAPGAAEQAPAPKPKKPRKPRAAPTGPHPEFIAWWCAEFERLKGVPYAVQGAKDGRAVKTMLGYARDDLDVLKARATALLETADPWLAERADLTMLCSQWNKLASAGKGPQRPANAPISADKFQEYVNRCEDPNVIKRT